MSPSEVLPCGRMRSLDSGWLEVAEFRLKGVYTSRHAHAYPALAIGVAGTLDLEISGEACAPLAPGSLVAIPAGLDHRERVRRRPARCLLLSCETPAAARWRPRPVASPSVTSLSAMLLEAFRSDDMLGLEAAGCELLGLADLDSAHGGEATGSPAWVERIAECLDDQFRSPPSLGALADEAGVTREHVARVFRHTTGLTVGQYVRKRRVLEGASRLRAHRADLSEVALACGFSDQSHFTREFRRHLRTTPHRYRRLLARPRSH